jgi:hypothetical protein
MLRPENIRRHPRKSAAAPARLDVACPGEPPQELLGDLLDVSEGGASMDVTTRQSPVLDRLRTGNLSGRLHVLLPDGVNVTDFAVETVWLVEHSFGSIQRFILGMRILPGEESRGQVRQLLETLPDLPDDTTQS